MKKKLIVSFFAALFFVSFSQAQSYKTAAGLQIDFGDGSTLVGPGVKYFFQDNSAIEGEVLFGDGATFIQAFYQYQKELPGAKGLEWYLGGGPSLGLGNNNTAFFLRPMVGLDYKTNGAPLALSFDWRPSIYLGNAGGSRFTGARFGIGIKYVVN